MKKIKSKDISIIIQGKIDNSKSITQNVIDSSRKHFPDSEIILSTWKGDEIKLINYDKLILSDDPGDPTPQGYKIANTARQILSTKNGLENSSRKYSIKTRTDVMFTNNKIFNSLYKFPLRERSFCITNDRVIVSNITSFIPNRKFKFPFHISDFIYAGKTKDLIKIFNAPLPDADDYSWYINNVKPKELMYFPYWVSRFSSESWLIYNLVKTKFDIQMDNSFLNENHDELLFLSEKIILSNFIILNRYQLGISSLKNKLPFNYFCFCYLHKDWLNMYRQLSGERKVYLDIEILLKLKKIIRFNFKNFLNKYNKA